MVYPCNKSGYYGTIKKKINTYKSVKHQTSILNKHLINDLID